MSSEQLVGDLRERVSRDRVASPIDARVLLRKEMIQLLELAQRHRQVKILRRGVPFVILVVGVNSVGKTTAIAKRLGAPIAYIGAGAKATDLAEFKAETDVDALFFGGDEGF